MEFEQVFPLVVSVFKEKLALIKQNDRTASSDGG